MAFTIGDKVKGEEITKSPIIIKHLQEGGKNTIEDMLILFIQHQIALSDFMS